VTGPGQKAKALLDRTLKPRPFSWVARRQVPFVENNDARASAAHYLFGNALIVACDPLAGVDYEQGNIHPFQNPLGS
jgi:hypothetical protein